MSRLATLCFIIFCTTTQAQTIASKADALLQAYTAQHKFSGTVLIAIRDSVVFNKAYGEADIKSHRANTVNTTFRAGSLTKMFTAAIVAQLVASNQLSYSDTISKYVPNADWCSGITVQQLLSHTSGIKGNTAPGSIKLSDLVTGFQPQPPAIAPGQRFEYNNFNYILLSYIAEKITHMPYPLLLQRLVLDKVGMYRSGIDSGSRSDADKAIGYTINPMTEEWVATGLGNSITAASGAGALYTTTTDLNRWGKAIHNKTVWPNNSYQQATTPVKGDYGMGWIVRRRAGHLQVGHTGAVEGFQSAMLLFPEDSVSVIYLSNLQDMNTAGFEQSLVALALGEPYQMPVALQEIQLSATAMQEYIGQYGKESGNRMQVQLEGGKLVVTAPGGDKLLLTASAKDHFFLKGPDIEIIFNRNGEDITSMQVKMGSGMLFEKVKP